MKSGSNRRICRGPLLLCLERLSGGFISHTPAETHWLFSSTHSHTCPKCFGDSGQLPCLFRLSEFVFFVCGTGGQVHRRIIQIYSRITTGHLCHCPGIFGATYRDSGAKTFGVQNLGKYFSKSILKIEWFGARCIRPKITFLGHRHAWFSPFCSCFLKMVLGWEFVCRRRTCKKFPYFFSPLPPLLFPCTKWSRETASDSFRCERKRRKNQVFGGSRILCT